MVAWTFTPAWRRASQNKLLAPKGLGPEFFDIAGGDGRRQAGVRTPSSCEAVACVADDGDDFEMGIETTRSLIAAGDRIIGFAVGATVVAAAGAIWLFA